VNQEIPSCGFCDLSQSAGQKPGKKIGTGEHRGKKRLSVVEEGEFGPSCFIETIEYWAELMRLAGVGFL
jgi:hypothetical protein